MYLRQSARAMCSMVAITLAAFSCPTAEARSADAGDINGDGFADLVIGAPDGAAGGEVNVLYGSAAGAAGQVIAFTAGLDFPEVGNTGVERGGIYTVRSNGTELRQLTAFQTSGFSFGGDGLILSDDHPSFSPDGSHIIFTSNRDAENLSVPVFEQDFEIYRMTSTGSDVVRLTDSPGVDTEPVYSPDGTKIAFSSARSGNLDIWVMNANGTNPVRLTTSPFHENEPAWSPDGTRIAYTRILDDGPLGLGLLPSADKDIYVMNADGSNNHLVAGGNKEQHDANWSPDGTKLAITGEGESIPFGDVVLINPQSGALISNLTVAGTLSGEPLFGGGDPSWSPDGALIAYFKSTGPLLSFPMRLFVMNADGTNKRFIQTPGLVAVHPSWGRVNDGGLTTSNNQLWSQNSSGILDSSESGDRFGAALAMGDFDHDGFGDVAIGVPNEKLPNAAGVTVSAGAVHVLYGTPNGLSATGNQFWHGASPGIGLAVLSGDTTGDRFGASLAVGDFDNDQFDDLAIGIPERFTTNVGAALILYGSAAGLSSNRRQVWSQETNGVPDTAAAGDLWASALAAGDFDNNGADDLAIGAPGEDAGGTDSGAVTILYGSTGSGLGVAFSQLWNQGTSGIEDTRQNGDRFGAALATGDFNGDNSADLAIGVPGELVRNPFTLVNADEAGAVNVLYGSGGSGLTSNNDQFLTRDLLSVDFFGDDLFGRALAAGDFNADGRDDLAVGIPLLDSDNKGGVEIFTGTSGGLARQAKTLVGGKPFLQDDRLFGGTHVPNEFFGSAVAAADFNGDGRSDLAVGAPGENLFNNPNSSIGSGGVSITFGSSAGLAGSHPQFFTQDSAGILGVAEIGERFGQALAGSSATGGAGFSGEWIRLTQESDGNPHGPHNFLLRGELDVFNPGTELAGRSVVRFYLSDNGTLGTDSTLLAENHIGPLKSQETRRVRITTALKSSASGKYVVAVLDANDAVVEIDELNNVVVSGPLE